ncbi:MAG TPA: hypothetical protein VKY74_26230 [Chloroflexia bacterium]|nr:hypothetical protein [Chloroflexia bacterium]
MSDTAWLIVVVLFVAVVGGAGLFAGFRTLATQLRGLAAQVAAGATRIDSLVQPLTTRIDSLVQPLTTNAGELKGVTQKLEQAHTQFSAALITLAEPEQLQDWVAHLQAAVTPLEQIRAQLADQHASSAEVLRTADTRMQQWATAGTQLAEQAGKMTDLLGEWQTRGQANLHDLERRVMARFAVLDKATAQIHTDLGLVSTQLQDLVTATGNVRKEMESVTTTLRELTAHQEALSKRQEKITDQLVNAAKALGTQNAALAQSVEALTKESDGITHRLRTVLDRLPTQQQQWLLAGLLGGVLIANLLVVAAVLLKP